MNRRFTMCVFLTVLALAGVWSVHSVGQDLFDSPPEESTATDEFSDDLFSDGDSSRSEDLFNDGDSGDEAEEILFDEPDDTSDNTFNESLEDPDELGGLDDTDLRGPVDADDLLGGLDDDLGGLGGGEPEADDEHGDVGINLDVGEDYDLILDLSTDTGGSYRVNAARSLNVQSRQATQQLSQVQQTILQRYMQTENKNTRDKLTEQLTDAVRREFDVRQKQRTKELKDLEKELKRLWSIHQRRDREKNTIVRNRVRQLIRDKEGLGWGSQNVSRRFR